MKAGIICADNEVPLFGDEGCSIHLREFANGMIEAGHQAFMVCAWHGEKCAHILNAPVYHLVHRDMDETIWQSLSDERVVMSNFLERDLRSLLFNEWMQRELPPILVRERPDFIYERYSLFGWGGQALARRFKVPHILEVNAPLVQEQNGYEKFVLMQTASRLEKEIFDRANAIVAVSKWIKDWLIEQGVPAEKIHVFSNGVADNLFKTPGDPLPIRARWDLAPGKVVGFLGSFQPWQDTPGLLDAFAQLRAAHADLRLLLVGDGPERERLQSYARELRLGNSVIFAGNIHHEQVPDYLAAMDVAVVPFRPQPNHQYGSSMKLVEYLAAARPVVAAAIGQDQEIVEHRRTGLLYPPGDENALIAAISELLDKPAWAAGLGQSGRRKILENYTWKVIASRVADLASSLISK